MRQLALSVPEALYHAISKAAAQSGIPRQVWCERALTAALGPVRAREMLREIADEIAAERRDDG